MLNKTHPLSRYKTNGGKNNDKIILMHFYPDAGGLYPWKLAQDATL